MRKHAAATVIEFEPEYVGGLKNIFEEMIVFNQLLGLKVTSIGPDRASGRIEMRRELIGHYSHNRIHGGVISASLDAMAELPLPENWRVRLDDALLAGLVDWLQAENVKVIYQ